MTNKSILEFDVSCLDGAVVELYHFGQVVDAGVCSSTSIRMSYTPASNGRYELNVKQTVAPGTPSYSNGSLEVTVDTLAPPAPITSTLSSDTNVLGDAVTSDQTLVFDGSSEPNTWVEFVSAPFSSSAELAVDQTGVWSLDYTATTLAEGSYGLIAKATDLAGNESANALNFAITVDITAPGNPTVNTLTTTDATPNVTGTYDNADNNYLTVTLNGTTYAQGINAELSVGGGTWQLQVPAPMAVGTYNVSVTSRDLAGNPSSDVTNNELQITSGGGVGFDGSACSGPDSDGDGVPDECDNCIGDKNPLQKDENRDGLGDRCDPTNITPYSPAYVKWNTYIKQWNFLELIAPGDEPMEVRVTVLNLLGQELIQTVVNIPAGSEMDVDINQLLRTACTDNNGPNCSGFSDSDGDGLIDSYGLVKVEFDNSDPDNSLVGRLTNYRPDPAGQPGVEGQSFSFAPDP